jgi:hypothetical protein
MDLSFSQRLTEDRPSNAVSRTSPLRLKPFGAGSYTSLLTLGREQILDSRSNGLGDSKLADRLSEAVLDLVRPERRGVEPEQ